MHNLPDPKFFSTFETKLIDAHSMSQNISTKNMDLNKFNASLLSAKQTQQDIALYDEDTVNPTTLLFELFPRVLLDSFEATLSPFFNRCIGYSKKHKSLTISIPNDDGLIEVIAIRHAYGADRQLIKWKSYGSKKFIKYKVHNDFIFLAVGMAEYILLELMKVSYILIQSDGMYRGISQKLLNKVHGKTIIILQENDESFFKLTTELKKIFIHSNTIVIDFQKLLNKKLKKGFDFRDFCNEIKDISAVEKQLEQEVVKQIKELPCE